VILLYIDAGFLTICATYMERNRATISNFYLNPVAIPLYERHWLSRIVYFLLTLA